MKGVAVESGNGAHVELGLRVLEGAVREGFGSGVGDSGEGEFHTSKNSTKVFAASEYLSAVQKGSANSFLTSSLLF